MIFPIAQKTAHQPPCYTVPFAQVHQSSNGVGDEPSAIGECLFSGQRLTAAQQLAIGQIARYATFCTEEIVVGSQFRPLFDDSAFPFGQRRGIFPSTFHPSEPVGACGQCRCAVAYVERFWNHAPSTMCGQQEPELIVFGNAQIFAHQHLFCCGR